MKKIHLMCIRGLPGSGKSTLAKQLAEKYKCKHFENDEYLMHDGKYVWTPDDAAKAAKHCFDDTVKALKSGNDVIVSNVFVTVKSINRYIDVAKKLGVEYQVIRLEKNYGNIHDVPDTVYNSMKKQFQDYPGEKIIK